MFKFLRIFQNQKDKQFTLHEDLLISTGQQIIAAGMVFAIAAYLGFASTWPLLNRPQALAAFVGFIVLTITCLAFLDKSPHVVMGVWLLGWNSIVYAIGMLFGQPALFAGWVIVPFIAVVIWDMPGLILTEAMLMALVVLVWTRSYVLGYVPGWGIIAGGLLGGIVGWASTSAYTKTNEWMYYYATQARNALEAFRDRQEELLQIQEDLLHANSELARMTKLYKALQQEADGARQAKSEFVANVSHELRAPLNMIIGFSEFIVNSPRVYGTRLPSALLADINTIRSNSLHLSKLVDDVIDLSQIESSHMALRKEMTNIDEIITTSVSAMLPLFESKGLYLESDVQPDLQPVLCDPNRIRQILMNLLSNAARFTETGGVNIKVETDETYIVFHVSDTGPGIAREDQAKLFQPFQQVDSSIRRKYGGSGLGLSICKSFVEMHNGRIWMTSDLNHGTTISFSLPMHLDPPPEISNAARWMTPFHQRDSRWRPYRAPDMNLKPRLVLCDQDSVLVRLFSRYTENIELVTSKDPKEALDFLTRMPSQALVINAPVDQAFNADWVNDLPYETPAVFCWVPGMNDVANELGVVRYLLKPVTAEMLVESLTSLETPVRSVLIVEDEPDLMRLYIRILSEEKPDCRFLRATSGQHALDMMREYAPDIVLMDLTLPEKDGFQVLQEKSGDPAIRDIPVIIVSARDPTNEGIVTNRIMITQPRGFTTQNLLDFIQMFSQELTPVPRTNGLKW